MPKRVLFDLTVKGEQSRGDLSKALNDELDLDIGKNQPVEPGTTITITCDKQGFRTSPKPKKK